MHLDQKLVAEVVGGDCLNLLDVSAVIHSNPREFLEEFRASRATG